MALTPDDENDISGYLRDLAADKRELKEVNFCALVGSKGTVWGFCIYHLFQQGDKTILHVRQAAMVKQNNGFANILARHLTDTYPDAIYEANQRWANPVIMKNKLVDEGLLDRKQAVLGYSDKYVSLLAQFKLRNIFTFHYTHGHQADSFDRRVSDAEKKKVGLKRDGKFWEAESAPLRAFSAVIFFKDMNRDDNFAKRDREYVKTMSAKYNK